jgi:hypothetical protein
MKIRLRTRRIPTAASLGGSPHRSKTFPGADSSITTRHGSSRCTCSAASRRPYLRSLKNTTSTEQKQGQLFPFNRLQSEMRVEVYKHIFADVPLAQRRRVYGLPVFSTTHNGWRSSGPFMVCKEWYTEGRKIAPQNAVKVYIDYGPLAIGSYNPALRRNFGVSYRKPDALQMMRPHLCEAEYIKIHISSRHWGTTAYWQYHTLMEVIAKDEAQQTRQFVLDVAVQYQQSRIFDLLSPWSFEIPNNAVMVNKWWY